MRRCAMDEPAIRIDTLCKTYAGGKRALDGVSFDVPRGQIFGLGAVHGERGDQRDDRDHFLPTPFR